MVYGFTYRLRLQISFSKAHRSNHRSLRDWSPVTLKMPTDTVVMLWTVNATSNLSAPRNDSFHLLIQQLYLRTHFSYMVFMCVILATSAVVGTLGNILVILTLALIRNLRILGNMFIVNLALADLVICSTIVPFNAVGALAGEFVYMDDNMLCNVIGSVCAPACMSSMWNMCLISLNRYVLICYPHLYKEIFTTRNTLMMCLMVWFICYLVHMPNHLGWGRISFNPDFYLCTADAFRTHTYALFYVAVGVAIPLTGVLYGYTAIFLKVRAVKLQMRAHRRTSPHALSGDIQLDNQTGNGVKTIQKTTKTRDGFTQEDVRLAKTLFMAFFIFSLSWTPFAALVLFGQPAIIPKWIYVLAMCMAHGNSAMNPIIYGLNNEKLREGYLRVIGCSRRIKARIHATSMAIGMSFHGDSSNRRRLSSLAATGIISKKSNDSNKADF